MWREEKQELREKLIESTKTALVYLAVWSGLMIPVVKMFL